MYVLTLVLGAQQACPSPLSSLFLDELAEWARKFIGVESNLYPDLWVCAKQAWKLSSLCFFLRLAEWAHSAALLEYIMDLGFNVSQTCGFARAASM
jgi:hypothetical protein